MRLKVNSCCCMSLRVGGLIIGWLGVVSLVLNFIYTILRANYELNQSNSNRNEDTQQTIEVVALIAFVFHLPGAIVLGLLITGILNNKHLLLLPWLVLKAFAIIILSLAFVIVLIYCAYYAIADPRPMEIDAYILGLFTLALAGIGMAAWFWIIIYSLYFEIRDNGNKSLPSQMQLPHVESGPADGGVPPYQKLDN